MKYFFKRAVEMTEACVYDKTRHCSMFSRGALDMALTEVKDKAAISRRLQCSNNLDMCMSKFYYSSLGVLQGEIMMANLSKLRDHVTSQVRLRSGDLSILHVLKCFSTFEFYDI